MADTSCEIIRKSAKKHYWHRDAFWPYPLQHSYVKGNKRLTIRFSITGNCVPGGILIYGDGDWIPANNRKEALRILET